MKLHRHKINYRTRRYMGDRNLYYDVGRFWHLYPDDSGEKGSTADGSYQIVIRKPKLSFAAQLHFGNAGSETPLDGHLILFGSGIYWGFSRGRRLANWLTSRKVKWQTRNIAVAVQNGHLRWDFWSNEQRRWKPGKDKKNARKRDYRYGYVSVDPRVWVWGPLRYLYEDNATYDTELALDGTTYPVTLTHKTQTLKRTKGTRIVEQRFILDIEAPKGVPTHVDHSSGWKGDRTYGWGISFPYAMHPLRTNGSMWYNTALELVMADVLKRRAESGFVKPDPVE